VDWQSFQATADPLSAATAWVPIPKGKADAQPLIAAHSVTIAKMRIFDFPPRPTFGIFLNQCTEAREIAGMVTLPRRCRGLSHLDYLSAAKRRRSGIEEAEYSSCVKVF
jgi:hypothetical protein